MMNEYWMLRRDDGVYWGHYGATWERLLASRYLSRSLAVLHARDRGGRWHLVHVRIRPRGERLYLAKQLAAWGPVVRAAEELRKRWDERASPAKQQDAVVAVVVACSKIPEK
jgi:hypothetical protein